MSPELKKIEEDREKQDGIREFIPKKEGENEKEEVAITEDEDNFRPTQKSPNLSAPEKKMDVVPDTEEKFPRKKYEENEIDKARKDREKAKWEEGERAA